MKNPFVWFAVLLFSCSQADKNAGNTSNTRNEIKTTIDNYYNDIRKEGLLAELKYLDSSREFFWVPPGFLNYAGYDSIAAEIRRNANSLKYIDNHYDSLLIIPLTDDYAQFVMRTVSSAIDVTGDTLKTAFIESGVIVKRKEGWRFLSGQTSLLQ